MVKIGIVGAGIMGQRMLRAAQDQAADVAEIVGVWDPSAEAMRTRFPDVPVASSPDSLIAQCECLYIASPPASHLVHARAAIAAGKAVFCEKPLATDVAAARHFVAEAAAARAAVNFPMASSFGVATLGEWKPAIGAVKRLEIEVAFRLWPRPWQHDAVGWLDGRAEGGFTREVVSHFLFLTRRMCGPINLLIGKAAFPEAGRSERRIEARLEAGGVPVVLRGAVGATEKDDHNTWTLIGEAGSIRLRDWSIAERLVDGVWQPDAGAMANEKQRPLVLRRQLEGVARMARGEAHHLATLAEALEVQEVVEAILAA
jgi:predicted dehydrogenase